MKRRIASLALAFVMIISVAVVTTGCGEDPMEIFKKASANMEGEWFSGEGEGTIELDMGGAKTSFAANFKLATIAPQKDDKENPLGQLKASYKMSIMGSDTEGAIYLKGNKMYSDADGIKEAIVLEDEVIEKISEAFNKDEKKLELEKYIKKEKKDGDKIILVFDGKACVEDLMESKEFKDTIGSEEDEATYNQYKDSVKDMLGDIEIEATVKNDKFTNFKVTSKIKVDMGALYDGESGLPAYDMTITVEFKNIKTGKDVKVNWPNFDEFAEY